MDFFSHIIDFIKFQSNEALPQTRGAFKALVDAIVPETPGFSEKQDPVQTFGAVDSYTDEYLMWCLDHYLSLKILVGEFNINVANLTAGLMNNAAEQLISAEENKKPVNVEIIAEEGAFAALAPIDRFHAITLLEDLKVNVGSLPIPFNIYPSFVLSTSFSIALLTMIGYYTEWSAYGSTRMNTPEKRKFEHFPIGWKQVGYPGRAMGYRAFRGYLIEKFTE